MKLEDMPEMQQRDILNLYDLGVKLSVGETSPTHYQLNFNRYMYSYELLIEEIPLQLQQAKIYRLKEMIK